jgi:hypothetical protein
MRTSKYRSILTASILAIVPLLAASCDNVGPERTGISQSNTPTSTVSVGGTVVFRDKDGGFFGILADNGGQYEPTNLSREFQTDGLRVKLTGKLDANHLGKHGWGNPVEIDQVQPRANQQPKS